MDYYRLIDKNTPVLEKNIKIWWDWYCNAPVEWRTVETTTIDRHTTVVTVYIGKDDGQHDQDEPPWLWQTELHHDDDCDVIWRYTTRAQAEFNHGRAVRDTRYRNDGVMYERRNRSLMGRVRRALKGLYK